MNLFHVLSEFGGQFHRGLVGRPRGATRHRRRRENLIAVRAPQSYCHLNHIFPGLNHKIAVTHTCAYPQIPPEPPLNPMQPLL